MPITPGSSAKLNTLKGVSSILVTTASEETSLSTKVLPAGILVKKSDGKVYLTDGVKTLANIDPLIDQVLTFVEKTALSTAFSTGSYVAASGGVVVHGANGKISDSELNVVSGGKIVESYLSDYIDPDTHKVLLSALPDTVRAGVTYVANITARNALSEEQKKSLAFVIDASDDTTVTQGSAMYGWEATANDGAGAWVKIAEVESLDIDVAAIRCDYNNVQAAGAVMYDHTVFLQTPTAAQFVTLQEADLDTPIEPDVPQHDETLSSVQQSYETFITNLAEIYESGNPDVYIEQPQISDFVLRVDATNVFSTDSDLTITITDTVTNLTASLPLAGKAYDNPNIRLAAVDSDDPMYGIIFENTSERETNAVTMVITDGTKTAIFNTTASGLYMHLSLPEAIITINTANGWSITN